MKMQEVLDTIDGYVKSLGITEHKEFWFSDMLCDRCQFDVAVGAFVFNANFAIHEKEHTDKAIIKSRILKSFKETKNLIDEQIKKLEE